MDRETLLDLIPAFALGALDDDDRAAVEALLATDDEARRLLAGYETISEALVLAAPARRAPAHLGADLRARLAARRETPQPAPALSVVPTSARRSALVRLWAPLAAVAAVLAVVAGVVLNRQPVSDGGAQLYAQLAAQAGVRRVPVTSDFDALNGDIVIAPDGTRAVIKVARLPAIESNQTFQLWLVDESGSADGGLLDFASTEGPNYIVVPLAKPAGEYRAFGVSIEPAGGSPLGNKASGPRAFAFILNA